jgi:hypothetical protein
MFGLWSHQLEKHCQEFSFEFSDFLADQLPQINEDQVKNVQSALLLMRSNRLVPMLVVGVLYIEWRRRWRLELLMLLFMYQ